MMEYNIHNEIVELMDMNEKSNSLLSVVLDDVLVEDVANDPYYILGNYKCWRNLIVVALDITRSAHEKLEELAEVK